MPVSKNSGKGQLHIQDSILNQLRKVKATIKLDLNNGDSITGEINSFDQFVILIKNQDGSMSLAYKSSIVQLIIPKECKSKIEIFS